MPTYVLVTKLSAEMARDLKSIEKKGREIGDRVRAKCPGVRWIAHYTLLGPYDFLDIFEAKDEEEAAKVSAITLSTGVASAESWTAIPWERFVELVKEL